MEAVSAAGAHCACLWNRNTATALICRGFRPPLLQHDPPQQPQCVRWRSGCRGQGACEQEGTHPAADAFLGRHTRGTDEDPPSVPRLGAHQRRGGNRPRSRTALAPSAVRYRFSALPLPSVAACDGTKGAGRHVGRALAREFFPLITLFSCNTSSRAPPAGWDPLPCANHPPGPSVLGSLHWRRTWGSTAGRLR
jgi:hypothetical protein